MQIIKKIHVCLSYLPVLWLFLFSLGVSCATIKLGHIPSYGKDPDPTELGIEAIEFFSTIIAIIAYIGFWAWILISFFYAFMFL